MVSDPVGQKNNDLGFGSVMAHLLDDLGNFPGLRAAARGGTFRPQVCWGAGANDDDLSPRLQPKTDASPVTDLLKILQYKARVWRFSGL